MRAVEDDELQLVIWIAIKVNIQVAEMLAK
jgi:hypothetical protein